VTEARPGWAVDDLRPAVDEVLAAFGPSHTMFGSDWPVCEASGGWARWAGAAEQLLSTLSAGELDDVLWGTAGRFYGLDLTAPIPSPPDPLPETGHRQHA
jgi:L-fuconolactonase